ncbi:MAG: twin-arginine translocase TatA/TatE family subunit [Acidimicrobiales bacterium]|nr:twin-arginine translocase TatA/TatE family subunit [Acidimicrobiales bacterium]
MFNLGGGEILVILLLALIVLGPAKLPEAARKMGQTLNELKKISKGFQDEFQSVLDEPVEAEARQKGEREAKAAAAAAAAQKAAKEASESKRLAAVEADRAKQLGSGTDDPGISTAAAAGMYDAAESAGSSAPETPAAEATTAEATTAADRDDAPVEAATDATGDDTTAG